MEQLWPGPGLSISLSVAVLIIFLFKGFFENAGMHGSGTILKVSPADVSNVK